MVSKWFQILFNFTPIVGKISQLASAYNLLFVYFPPNAVKSPPEKNSWDLEIFVACGIWKNRGKNVVKKYLQL